ncbi:MAG: hypothetical protein IKU04_05510 [Bacteroidales bacterium]|nr:hypothetical protein [Bacteroidales bacterium]
MMKTVRFFKINGGRDAGWYADVPGHTLAENEMVAGSDDFLEAADKMTGSDREVHITLSDTDEGVPFLVRLRMKNHNQWGATYVLSGPLAERHGAVGFELWVCNVTHDVLGEHPREIFIQNIK